MSLTRGTRGKTRPGRLRLIDPFILEGLPTGEPVQLLDIGIGAEPDTSIELHRAALAAGLDARTLGTDVDPERVARLTAADLPGLSAAQVDDRFAPGPRFHRVRAANLLRQYRLDRVHEALVRWGSWVAPGGRMVEGTTDKTGSRGVFRVFKVGASGAMTAECLVAVVDLDGPGFAPRALTAYLPRGLGWHGHPGPEVAPVFEAWTACWREARSQGANTVRSAFIGAAERMAERRAAEPDPHGWAEGRIVLSVGAGARLGVNDSTAG